MFDFIHLDTTGSYSILVSLVRPTFKYVELILPSSEPPLVFVTLINIVNLQKVRNIARRLQPQIEVIH